MNTHKGLSVEFVDKYGEQRVIHANKNGLALKRMNVSPCIALNRVAGKLVGEKIRAKREERGMSMAELCVAAGIVSATPKSRMWEIEKGVRNEGIRLGTLYAIAHALRVEPWELLPTVAELTSAAGVRDVRQGKTLAVKS